MDVLTSKVLDMLVHVHTCDACSRLCACVVRLLKVRRYEF